VSVVVAELCKF